MITIYASGINYKTAPIEIRERASLGNTDLLTFLNYSKEVDNITEYFVISTCNRTEFYAIGDNNKFFQHVSEYLQSKGVSRNYIYEMTNQEAIKHFFRVICGIDSMVLGETQILSQCKEIYQLHQQAESIKKYLHKLIQKSFHVSKQVRSKTPIGSKKTSVASIAVSWAKKHKSDLGEQPILLIGAGDTTKNIALHLSKLNTQQIIIINRSDDNAKQVAGEYQLTPMPWSDRYQLIKNTSTIFSATSAFEPIIQPEMLAPHTQQLMIDLAIPRNVNPTIIENPNKTVINIDRLQVAAKHPHLAQQKALNQAENIIQHHTKDYMKWLESTQFKPLLDHYQTQCQHIKQNILDEALTQLKNNQTPEHILRQTVKKLTQQLMHPTLKYFNYCPGQDDDKKTLMLLNKSSK